MPAVSLRFQLALAGETVFFFLLLWGLFPGVGCCRGSSALKWGLAARWPELHYLAPSGPATQVPVSGSISTGCSLRVRPRRERSGRACQHLAGGAALWPKLRTRSINLDATAGGGVSAAALRSARISVQGSMSFTGHAESAVTQIYPRYTEKGGQGGHQGRKLPASSAEIFVFQLARRTISQVSPGCQERRVQITSATTEVVVSKKQIA